MFSSTDVEAFVMRPSVAQALCVFFVLLIGLQAISLYQGLASPSAPAPRVMSKPQSVNLNSMLEAHLFGDYTPKQLGDMDVKPSALNIILVGILYSEDEHASQVIVKGPGIREQSLGVGDAIIQDTIIKKITPNGVLLSRHGVLESLSLPKDELIFSPVPKPLKD